LPNRETEVFTFRARVLEELVCTGPGGFIQLQMPGFAKVYLPPVQVWKEKAPEWAQGLWPELRADLERWCADRRVDLVIDETANVCGLEGIEDSKFVDMSSRRLPLWIWLLSRPRMRMALAGALVVAMFAIVGGLLWVSEEKSFYLAAGSLFVAIGVVSTLLYVTPSGRMLEWFFGPAARDLRQSCRRGWVGLLIVPALLAIYFGDRWYERQVAASNALQAHDRGQTALKAGDWQRAVDEFTAAINVAPPDRVPVHRLLVWRGIARVNLKEYAAAIDDFNEAIAREPNDANAHFNRGVAYANSGDRQQALADFSEAIRLNPKYQKAYGARAKLYQKMGDEARAAADEAEAARLHAAPDASGAAEP
jgi:Tfp pilus assembly protein PilF